MKTVQRYAEFPFRHRLSHFFLEKTEAVSALRCFQIGCRQKNFACVAEPNGLPEGKEDETSTRFSENEPRILPHVAKFIFRSASQVLTHNKTTSDGRRRRLRRAAALEAARRRFGTRKSVIFATHKTAELEWQPTLRHRFAILSALHRNLRATCPRPTCQPCWDGGWGQTR